METNLNRSDKSRAVPFVLGTLFGCLSVLLLGGCLVGMFVVAAARSGTNGGIARQPDSPVANGRQVFQTRCSYCHSTGTDQEVGPGLAGLFSPGGPSLPAGVDYDGRLPNGDEITEANVAGWIRVGGSGEIGTMPGQSLSEAQMEALIAYLKTLDE